MRSISASAISGFVRAARQVLGHAGLRHPLGVAGPAFRQKQAQADHHRNLVPRQRQRHQRLAIGGLAERRGVLRRDADRMRPLLRQRRVVDDKDCAGSADQLVRLDREFLFQRRFVPDAARNEMMQLVVVAGRPSRRHRLDALAVARPNQPRHVERAHPPARLVSEPRQERRKPPLKIPIPIRHAGSAKSRSQRSGEIPSKLLICQSLGEGARSEQFRDAPRDRETRGQARRFYAKQVDQPSDPVFVLSLDHEIGR